MPVDFLTDDERAHGRYTGPASQADLERVFFLDDEDRKLVDLRRGDHMKAGLALQLVTVRWLGTFLEDPLDVPGEVLDFVAGRHGGGPAAVLVPGWEQQRQQGDRQAAASVPAPASRCQRGRQPRRAPGREPDCGGACRWMAMRSAAATSTAKATRSASPGGHAKIPGSPLTGSQPEGRRGAKAWARDTTGDLVRGAGTQDALSGRSRARV